VPDTALERLGKIVITPAAVIVDGLSIPFKFIAIAPYLLFYEHSI
jgi:hypothetical protein